MLKLKAVAEHDTRSISIPLTVICDDNGYIREVYASDGIGLIEEAWTDGTLNQPPRSHVLKDVTVD